MNFIKMTEFSLGHCKLNYLLIILCVFFRIFCPSIYLSSHYHYYHYYYYYCYYQLFQSTATVLVKFGHSIPYSYFFFLRMFVFVWLWCQTQDKPSEILNYDWLIYRKGREADWSALLSIIRTACGLSDRLMERRAALQRHSYAVEMERKTESTIWTFCSFLLCVSLLLCQFTWTFSISRRFHRFTVRVVYPWQREQLSCEVWIKRFVPST